MRFIKLFSIPLINFTWLRLPTLLKQVFYAMHIFKYCPNKEAALGNIVVSLSCTAYLWAALIVLQEPHI